MARPKGSKNKIKTTAININDLAQRHADLFIAAYHIEPAERLAELIVEKIRASSKRLKDKYGAKL